MNSTIFQCFCDSRCLSSSMSRVLDDPELTPEEKALLYEVLIDVQQASNKIQDFCKNGEL